MRQQLIALSSIISTVTAVKCMQCQGWSWNYPGTQASQCDNQNNQCNSDGNMCVRITDPMRQGANYETFKLDCWNQPSLQVSPGQNQPIVAGQCYNYQDGSNPPKRFKYCFCNNIDWCNGIGHPNYLSMAIIFISFLFYSL